MRTACVFHHAITEGLVDPRRMIQIGIRSPVAREIHDWTLAQGVSMITAGEGARERSRRDVAQRIRAVVGDAPAYLSFDIDALDPAFAPGTGTPEIGGLASWCEAQAILRRLAGLRFVGMDVVEVAPAYDVAEITALTQAPPWCGNISACWAAVRRGRNRFIAPFDQSRVGFSVSARSMAQ